MPDRAVPALDPLFPLRAGAFGITRVVSCSGELDLATAPAAQEAPETAIRHPECVPLDLSGRSFMDIVPAPAEAVTA